MCGIFGCLSQTKQNLIQKTLQGLKILEYRGYDSAGIAFLKQENHQNKIEVIKSVGDIGKLSVKIINQPDTTVCIGHTRWATNGKVNLENSHPHLSNNATIAVVHNGIIENYKECRKFLIDHQIKLKTPVDTEVIPNILYLLSHNKHDIHKYLQGQYVFCSLQKDNNSLFIAKKGNPPLYIGRDKTCFYVTSDTLSLPQSVTEIITMNDLETCEITDNQLYFFHQGKPIQRQFTPFNQSFIASDKNGFTTFMEKEINEIPRIFLDVINQYCYNQKIISQKNTFRNLLRTTKCVHLCGCGTSYHACLILAKILERKLHIRAIPHISSELRPSTLLNEPAIAIVISQSGETADTLTAMDILQNQQIPIIAFCNVTTSTIAKRSKITFPLLSGPEIAVASTKVFCAAVLIGCLLINDYTPTEYKQLISHATSILRDARKILPQPEILPQKIFVLGKDINYAIALESALKIKEITYLHCEGYPANELKHGPLSMVDNHTLAIAFGKDTQNAITEIQARGGNVINIFTEQKSNPLFFICEIIPAQIFALDLANRLGFNPDKPRNLAKSVTVL